MTTSHLENKLKPNIFFIGSPKCGTTSMAKYLDSHPEIYVSKPKEPHWFPKEPQEREFESFNHYLNTCFPGHDDQSIWIDANVMSLHVDGAIDRILNFNENAKFLVLLRNPIEASYSLFRYLKARYEEDANSFKEAWDLQDPRKRGKKLPKKTPNYPGLLQYGEMYKYGERIERLFGKVSRNNVKIIKLSEMNTYPQSTYKSVLNFLNLRTINKTNFDIENKGRKRHSKLYFRILQNIGNLKKKIGIPYLNTGIMSYLDSLNKSKKKPKKLDPTFKNKLKDFFWEDTRKLKDLTGINIWD